MIGPDGTDPTARWAEALSHGSFEETFAALEQVVARLEAGQLTLEESVDCYELGVRLAERCDHLLREAELRVSQLEAIAARLEEEAAEYDDAPAAE